MTDFPRVYVILNPQFRENCWNQEQKQHNGIIESYFIMSKLRKNTFWIISLKRISVLILIASFKPTFYKQTPYVDQLIIFMEKPCNSNFFMIFLIPSINKSEVVHSMKAIFYLTEAKKAQSFMHSLS